jgi:hypothetical protein
MNNKIERIRNVNELNKTGDLTDKQSMEIISNILSEKGFYKITPSYKKSNEPKIMGNRRNKKWTKDDDNKLRKYVANNYSPEKIAMKLGRTRHFIDCRKNILGLKFNPRNLPYKPSRFIQSWEDDEVLELYKLKAEEKTNREIAEQLGKTIKQITNKLHVMKLSGGIDAWKAKRGYN